MALQSIMATLLAVPDEYILLHRWGYGELSNFPMKLIERNHFMENFWPALLAMPLSWWIFLALLYAMFTESQNFRD